MSPVKRCRYVDGFPPGGRCMRGSRCYTDTLHSPPAPGARSYLKECPLNPILVVLLIIWLVSAVGLVVFVLLHSGKGTGLSDMLAGGMTGINSGTSIIEKNLDRITIGFAVAFMVSLLALMLAYPNMG